MAVLPLPPHRLGASYRSEHPLETGGLTPRLMSATHQGCHRPWCARPLAVKNLKPTAPHQLHQAGRGPPLSQTLSISPFGPGGWGKFFRSNGTPVAGVTTSKNTLASRRGTLDGSHLQGTSRSSEAHCRGAGYCPHVQHPQAGLHLPSTSRSSQANAEERGKKPLRRGWVQPKPRPGSSQTATDAVLDCCIGERPYPTNHTPHLNTIF